MPQVPYTPYPTAQPSTQGVPTLRLDTPGEAFGTNIGRAIEGFGVSLEHDSDKIFQRAIALQEMQNETAARNQDVENSKAMAKADIDFSTLEGVNASPQALEKHLQNLQDIYQQNRAALPNDDARRRYDSFALSTFNRSMFSGMRHAATETKNASIKSAEAQASMDDDALYHAGTNGTVLPDSAIQTYLDKARNSAGGIASAKGFDDTTTKDFTDRYTSRRISHYLSGLSQSNPQLAQQLADKYRDEIHGEDLPRLEKSLEVSAKTTQARIEVDKITAPLWHPDPNAEPPSQKELLDQVDAKSEELHPGDAVFRDAMRSRLIGSVNTIDNINRKAEAEKKQYLIGAVAGYTNPDGKKPTTPEELFVDPRARAYYQGASNSDRKKIDADLARNSKGDYVETPARTQEFQRLHAMGSGYASDADREAFLAINTNSLELPIPQRKELWSLQEKVREGMAKNPAIGSAMRVMFPDLVAAQITPALDKDGYYRFQGVLNDWMSDYIRQHGRSPKNEEILETGRRMLYERTDPATFEVFGHHIGLFDTTTRMFKDVPNEDIEKGIQQYKDEHPNQRAPTNEEMARYIVRARLHALEKKPSAGEGNE